MKKRTFYFLLVVALVACKNEKKETAEMQETAEAVNTLTSENEWMLLFDGSSYDHWKGYLASDIYPEWTIEDGAMAFTPGKEGGKNIISKEKYTNFILSLEWKVSKGANSGIFWSVHEDPAFKEAYETGPEIQVLDNAGHPDAKAAGGTHTAGSLYDMIACPDDVINPAGEWNLCVLEVNHKTNQGKVTMNGKEVMTFAVHGDEWDNMVAKSKFKDWEGFGKYQTGHIGLQDHGDKIWFKNIKIKEL